MENVKCQEQLLKSKVSARGAYFSCQVLFLDMIFTKWTAVDSSGHRCVRTKGGKILSLFDLDSWTEGS